MSDLKKIKCALTASVCAVLLAANSISVYAAPEEAQSENVSETENNEAIEANELPSDAAEFVTSEADTDPGSDVKTKDDTQPATGDEAADVEASEKAEDIKKETGTENGNDETGSDDKTDTDDNNKDTEENGSDSDPATDAPVETGTDDDDQTSLFEHEPYHGSVSSDGKSTELIFDGAIGNEDSDKILGDSWFYGVVANDFTFNGESETNFAVETFHHVYGGEGGQTGVTDKADGAERGWFVAGTVDAPFMIKGIGADITTPSDEENKFENSTNGGDLKFHELSQEEINAYVTNLRNDVAKQSTRLAKLDSITNYENLPQNKMTVDVTSAGQGTVYINVDKWEGLKNQLTTQSSGVTIKKNPGQKVVLNFPESTSIVTQKLMIQDGDQTYDSATLANDSTKKVSVAADIIINAPKASSVTLSDTCAIILAPNAEVKCYGVGGGWVTCDKMVNECEWHFTNGSLPKQMELGERRPKAETSKGETPKGETPKEESPKDETTKKETPEEGTPKEESPKDETTKEESPKDETAKKETPEEGITKEESPKDETTKEESPKEESPKEGNTKPSETPKKEEQQPVKPEIPEKTDRPETPEITHFSKHEVPVVPNNPTEPTLPRTPLNEKPSKTIEKEVPLQPETSKPNIPFEKRDTTEVITKDHTPGSNSTEETPTATSDLNTPQLTSTEAVSDSAQSAAPAVSDSSQTGISTVSGSSQSAASMVSDTTQIGTPAVSDSSENVTSTISDSPQTGDNSHVGAYAASWLGSIAALFGIAIFGRKRRHR